MGPFEYPETSHARRHGPRGYADYTSYRPWLRDEFTFRCVYCLKREQWGRESGDFDLDHFRCQAKNPEAGLEYDNLLYSCHQCNQRKGAKDVPDPCSALTADRVCLLPDGTLYAESRDAKQLIDKLCLNSKGAKNWRLMWTRIVELAEEHDREHWRRLMRFPEDLPDLSRLQRSKNNLRPEGIEQSYFARRQRGELAETY